MCAILTSWPLIGDPGELQKGQIVEASGRFLKVHGISYGSQFKSRSCILVNYKAIIFTVRCSWSLKLQSSQKPKKTCGSKSLLTVVMVSFFLCVLWLYVIDIRNSEKYRTRPKRRMSKPGKKCSGEVESGDDAGTGTAEDKHSSEPADT